jgi:hypothetical protein
MVRQIHPGGGKGCATQSTQVAAVTGPHDDGGEHGKPRQVVDHFPAFNARDRRWPRTIPSFLPPFVRDSPPPAIFLFPSAAPPLHLQFCKTVQSREGLMPEIVVHAFEGRSVEQKRL